MARKNDSLVVLTARLADVPPPPAAAAPSPPTAAPPVAAAPRLYQQPVITATDAELPEVLSLLDSTTTFQADYYPIKAFRICNGPTDTAREYCNCSHYVYIALNTDDLPYECKGFRIGPFYEARFKGWNSDKKNPALRIEHEVGGRRKTDTFRIAWDGGIHQQ
ncbi:hypothetical protein [Hymenobacter algoricola]|uniref:Uncharacterized protein n=1 Tax=Hymenobacter algoricola TaxID=486267 RepID=A0ABP7MRW9_9BACT